MTEETMPTIICGVDGSPAARAAVRVAASLADRLGARLLEVHIIDPLASASDAAARVAAGALYTRSRTLPRRHGATSGTSLSVSRRSPGLRMR